MSPPLGCLEHNMQLREPCFVNSGSWNCQGLSLGLYNPQTFLVCKTFFFIAGTLSSEAFGRKKITLQGICLGHCSSGTFFPGYIHLFILCTTFDKS